MLADEKPKTRGKGRINKAVKEAVERAFSKVNDNDEYLIWLSKEHPPAFVSLIARCIPAAVAVSVTHQFDLGEAMQIAANNAQRLNAPDTPNTIEHNPISDNMTDETSKPLITNET